MGLGHRDGKNSVSFLIPYVLVGPPDGREPFIRESLYKGVKDEIISLKGSNSRGKRNTY